MNARTQRRLSPGWRAVLIAICMCAIVYGFGIFVMRKQLYGYYWIKNKMDHQQVVEACLDLMAGPTSTNSSGRVEYYPEIDPQTVPDALRSFSFVYVFTNYVIVCMRPRVYFAVELCPTNQDAAQLRIDEAVVYRMQRNNNLSNNRLQATGYLPSPEP